MEGPGVYLIRKKLSFLEGEKILGVDGNTRKNKSSLNNKEIRKILSFGKRLVFDLGKNYLIIHFLMYGSFKLDEKDDSKRERLQLIFKDHVLNFYNTSIKIVDKKDFFIDRSIDVMSNVFNIGKAKERIREYHGYICDLLLNQNVFAGVGNIIKNESLFRSKIHPLSLGVNVEDDYVTRLIDNVIEFSQLFYKVRKENGYLREHLLIYGKKFCCLCNLRIKLKHLGEMKRKTYYCEKCQLRF